MVSRTSSDGPPPGGGRQWKSLINKIPRRGIKIISQHAPENSTSDLDLHLRSPDSHSTNPLESQETHIRQLQTIVQRMPRNFPTTPNHVDSAYKDFTKHKEQCATLCRHILTEELGRGSRNGGDLPRRDSTVESPQSPGQIYDTRSSFSGRSLAEVVSGSVGKSIHQTDAWLSSVRDWKNYLESLADACRTSLIETYKNNERDATPEQVEALFTNKRFRKEAVQRMRNASVTRVMSADPQFFPKYEMRFYDYERIKQELNEIRQLLQTGESGISPDRTIKELAISQRGDAILEFANNGPGCNHSDPALRFRVSSYMLAETSPIFARMFAGHSSSLHLYDDDDISTLLPLPPTKYFCKDGSEAKLYRMPQVELNHLGSLEILLHAAHMHNEMVPREIEFEQFVAIAECCMRYKSTSPLELIVEHRWLPQWMHKGADDMPDGLLVISYAFGLRRLFSRMSKTTILNLVDEKELLAKPWPQKIKDKIWAVRCAKMAQIHECCVSTIREYMREPTHNTLEGSEELSLDTRASFSSDSLPPTMLTSTPRCPKGSHWCDATNLGWLMLLYNEMNLLPHIMAPDVLSHLPRTQPQSKSLAQIVDALRRIPPPPTPIHRGVCDPGPMFRSAISDIYNSVLGLTLFDISGKSHGWGLSKHREREPQTQLNKGLGRMAAPDPNYSVATEFPEIVRLRILCQLDEIDDLHTAAMINRAYYETYKKHELYLMRNILRMDRKRTATRSHIPIGPTTNEEKVLRDESEVLKRTPVDTADGITLHSVIETEGDYTDSDSDSDSLCSTSVTPSLPRSAATTSTTTRGRDYQGSSDPVLITDRPARTPRARTGTPTSRSTAIGSPTTPRQAVFDPPPPPITAPSITIIDEPPLTVEEANRILWPEDAIRASESPLPISPTGIEGIREKFRAGDPAFDVGLEEKTLVPTGEKQLRSEHDRQVGLLKGAANVHPSITRDREWFEDDYMAFSSIIYHTRHKPWGNVKELTNHGEELDPEDYTWAHGVGTVKLKTRRFPGRRRAHNHGEIILKNVIFAPDYICNIIGANIAHDGYVVEVDPTYGNPCAGEIRDNTGSRVAHFRELTSPMQHIEVRLCGPPYGRETKQRSPFHPEVKHDIRAKWPATERLRFEMYRSTRSPSVNIGDKPWSEEELQRLKCEGKDPDEVLETLKKRCAEEKPEHAEEPNTDLMMAMIRGKQRELWLKNPFQDRFDYYMGYRESEVCEWLFSPAQRDFVCQAWRNTKDFMDMFGYKHDLEDDCMMAAIQVKDLMREEGFEVSSDDEWEDMDEDESGWEDTDEDMCECEGNKCECPASALMVLNEYRDRFVEGCEASEIGRIWHGTVGGVWRLLAR
ncbi:hypothetical protein FGADI_11636 [Fusarium gaditjirri]|uniref:Uncharacterized protein n=1 Tax=Fusarium gaditjirri TaxID=282569 RepID=A0A8H4SUB6_9HYPO|nr:hypothetical protein FGADI_11636 [Fusarium gaditjirri]